MRSLGRVPPVAVPIRAEDVREAAAEFRRGACSERFAAALAAQTKASAVRLFSSGRAALTCLLVELARQSPRREVVTPAYACYTLPAAVARAGLRVRLCDVSPDTLDFEPAALDQAVSDRTLAVVAVHVLGFRCDLGAIGQIARHRGAVLVEDCAQLLKAECSGGPIRERGDLALLSFGRGKPITTLGGGALLCFDLAWEGVLDAAARGLRIPANRVVATLARVVAYGILTRPLAYRAVERVPGFGIGVTRFAPSFPVLGLDEARAAVGLALLPQLAGWNQTRRQNADEVRAALRGTPGVLSAGRRGGEAPLRFPIRVAPHMRAELLRALQRVGIGASPMYPSALSAVPEIRGHLAEGVPPCPGACEVAQTLLTLPCHPTSAGLAPLAAEVIAGVTRRLQGASGRAGLTGEARW